MLRLSIIAYVILLSGMFHANAQEKYNYPKIGDKLNHVFTDVSDKSIKSVSISERKGKWLVLDFWTRGCTGCIASFPKMDELSRSFQDVADIYMVGLSKPNSEKDRAILKDYFGRWVKNKNMHLKSAFDTTGNPLDIYRVPSIFIINPDGELVGKAASIDSLLLSDFIAGTSPKYEYSYSAHEPQHFNYNVKLPLLTSGQEVNGGIDTTVDFRSVLTRFKNPMMDNIMYGFNTASSIDGSPGWAELIGFTLRQLYTIGYAGQDFWLFGDPLYEIFSRKLALEIKDTRPFKSNRVSGAKEDQNYYSYSLKQPLDRWSFKNNRRMLIQDLDRYFGYVSNVEIRNVKILKLVVTNQKKVKKLATSGYKNGIRKIARLNDDEYYLSPDSSIWVTGLNHKLNTAFYNKPFKDFFKQAGLQSGLDIKNSAYNNGKSPLDSPPIFDCTGINYKIDINLDCDLRDWEATLEVLKSYGLGFVEAEIPMKCIVIRDAKND